MRLRWGTIAIPACLLAAGAPPFYRDKSDLLYYLDAAGARHEVRSRADWEKRRRDIQANMEQVMGTLPQGPKVPLDIQVVEEVREPAYTRKKLTYVPERGDRVPAYLFIPNGRQGPLPAMLCLHQTIKIGKAEPAGLGGSPDLHYAQELAERGYVTLAPDYPNFGDYQFDPYAHGYASATIKGIWNHIRAVDLLASLPQVDPRRIGVIGHSLGGHNSLFLAVFDPRVRVVVTSCGFNSFAKYYGGNLTGWSHKGYMPRIAEVYGKSPERMPFDFTEVLGALAPRPVFINAPLKDANFEVSGVRDCLAAALPVYTKIFRAGDRLVAVHPDAAHSFPPDARRQAYAFVDRWLGRASSSAQAELIEVRKIWDQGAHNAFTDLVRFHDRWYCAFREAKAHVSPDGALRILSSSDGETWSPAALLTARSDLRDPKLALTPEGRLMLTTYSVIRESRDIPARSLAWFSKDGSEWGEPAMIGDPDFWLWRVTWHNRTAYSVGYNGKITRLYASRNGRNFFTLVKDLFDQGYPNESSLLFQPDGTALCLLRRDAKGANAMLGAARPPYRDWTWKDLGMRLGGPHMIRLPDGRLIAAGRLYDGRVRTSLCWLDAKAGRLTEFLALPSGGDTSYPGLVLHGRLLWVSYYSSHEGKTSIYLAKVRLRP